MELDRIYKMDCIEGMRRIDDASIDLVLTDPHYGTTASRWDNVIDFNQMWGELLRITKPNKAIVLFGAELFSSKLRLSRPELFKYDWIWVKNNPVGFVNAKLMPMKRHEIISVFSTGKTSNGNKNNMPYYPQGLIPFNKKVRNYKNIPVNKDNSYYRPSMGEHNQEFTNYPTTILNFKKEPKPEHPTQKPVALMEYLIRTYTLEGENVLDFTMGTGTTAVACIRSGRHFIGFETDDKYFGIAERRIREAQGDLKLDL